MSYKRKIQQAISLKQHGGSSLAAIREAIIKMHWLNVFKTSMHICKISMTQFIKNINKKTRIHCIILNGKSKGETMSVFRVKLQVRRSAEYPYLWTRTQFPLRLAWAMTINKSQGQSIRVVGIDLTFECFAHGQLYVALSRASGGPHLYSNTSEESGLPNVVIYKES